jgi:hypothetical protein
MFQKKDSIASSESRAVCEIMCKNIVEADRPHDRHVCISGLITKATDTHLEYVTLTASPLQRRLQERPSFLRYVTLHYVHCLNFNKRARNSDP